MLARLREIASQRRRDWGGEPVEFGGEDDHVHLLLTLPPSLELSGFVNNLKTTSSRLLRREFAEHLAKFYWKPVFWSRSYCIVSCGGAPLEIVKRYLESQNEPG
jgi:putative transposase